MVLVERNDNSCDQYALKVTADWLMVCIAGLMSNIKSAH